MIKIQSAQVASSKKKVDHVPFESQKGRTTHKKVQKVDFKKIIGKSKHQREQAEKTNQEELKAQMDLVNYHRNTKNFLETMK